MQNAIQDVSSGVPWIELVVKDLANDVMYLMHGTYMVIFWKSHVMELFFFCMCHQLALPAAETSSIAKVMQHVRSHVQEPDVTCAKCGFTLFGIGYWQDWSPS